MKELASTHGTSVSTAQRAVKLLDEWGFVELKSGRRTLVRYVASAEASSAASSTRGRSDEAHATHEQPRALDLEVRQLGKPLSKFRAEADPDNTADLRHCS